MELLKDNQGVIWTSPNNEVFYLKTLTNEYTKKHIGEIKENPKPKNSNRKKIQDSNDTFTDFGVGGKDIPLECYFIGEDHAQKAEEFANALCLTGKSKLKLVYEDEITVNVIRFSRKNDLIKNINCTIINVDFHETSNTTYPESTTSKTKEIKNISENARAGIAETLKEHIETITDTDTLESFSESFSSALDKVSNELSLMNNVSLNSIMTDILSQNPVNNIYTITSQLGIVLYKAALLANKTKNTITDFSIEDYINDNSGNWSSLISNLISFSDISKETLTKEEINKLIINDSIASMAIISYGESLLEKEYDNRSDAVEAAKTLKDFEVNWTGFIENQYSKIDNLEDVINNYIELTNIINLTASEILERSYKLKVEQIITLSEDTTLVDIAYKYYYEQFKENPDETIDYLIATNGLEDDEIFLLRKGKEIKIYV